tara:strand:- start:3732 stop:4487 length:756 start_codon:yes stop_codon:yes gene_type:complete
MGASTAGKDRKDRQDNSNKQKANEITEVVKKRLGLTTLPNTPPPGTKNPGKWASQTSTLALNLQGKDKGMYGIEASKFTNDEMIKKGLAKEGNYFQKVGGEFIRLSKAEGRKLYATGDPNISRSVFHTSNSMKIKYGGGNNAVMGSGDPSGAMSSIPISSKMLESQNKAQAMIGLAAGAALPLGGGFLSNAITGKASVGLIKPGKAYDEYTKKFQAKQSADKKVKSKITKKSSLLSDAKADTNKLKLSLGE